MELHPRPDDECVHYQAILGTASRSSLVPLKKGYMHDGQVDVPGKGYIGTARGIAA
jgi:hypothetical protein